MQPSDGTNTAGAPETAGDLPRSSAPNYIVTDVAPLQIVAAVGNPERSTEVLKVSTRSRPSAVAGAIAGVMRERATVDVQSIGAGATNQAVKAIAIARGYLRDDGIDICCVPSFIDVAIDGDERTALRLLVQRRVS